MLWLHFLLYNFTLMDIIAILSKLGFDWQMSLANTFNFLIIFIILGKLFFKPIKAIIDERQKEIQCGIDKAKEADIRLKEVDVMNKTKIKETQSISVGMINETEKKIKIMERNAQKDIEEKQLQLQKDLQETYQKQQEEMKSIIFKNAFDLVKKTVIKAVELKPDEIDEALIKKAASALKS